MQHEQHERSGPLYYSAATVQYGRYHMAALIKAFSESFACLLFSGY
jgi:hypothetical protein